MRCAACPFDLGGMTIVLDCAHGATYRVAPKVFRSLGARVIVLGARPGRPQHQPAARGAPSRRRCRKRVLSAGAHLGIAFDGDGDRLISVDERGEIRDGDYALAICGRHMASKGRLTGGRGRDHRDGQSRARQGAPGRRRPDGEDPGRGPLRARGDAEGRGQPGRRAIGPPALPRSLDHGGRHRVRAAPARRHAGDRAAALRAGARA